MKKFLENNSDYFYFAFRVLVGLGFLLHGIQKLSGIAAGKILLSNLMFYAGIIETFGGIFIIIGLLTRYTAVIAALEMLYAYIFVHASSKGINPMVNNGEPAYLYFACFLVLLAFGARKWAFDKQDK